MSGILIKDVRKSFGETRALTSASLAARVGEVHAIVGENGSGKSTLAKIISGVLAPDAGLVQVLGETPRDPQHMKRIGVETIFQEMMLAEQLSITENVFAGFDGFFRKRLSSRAKHVTTKTLIERLSGQPIDPAALVAELPLHLKQWIVLARALRTEPRVLILDESSAALDLAGTERLHAEIRRLRDRGVCVILVTHRIAELVKIADGATVLRDGETVGTLSKSEITEQNLLGLMSANKHPVGARSTSARPGVKSAEPVLRGTRIQLSPGSAPFDFSLDEGQIVGVTGLDGAGQTEFVRALAGIDAPFAGSVEGRSADGRSIGVRSITDADQTRISYVSGDRRREGIFPGLSTFENFGLALYSRFRAKSGLIDVETLRRAFDVEVERLGIKVGPPSNRITALSGGNQQKVLIARAFASNPKVIVLNDPARGVDIGTKQELYRQLAAFADGGGAVVYLTSEIEELFGFADRVDVFVRSTLSASVAAEDVSDEALLYAMFGQRVETSAILEAAQ